MSVKENEVEKLNQASPDDETLVTVSLRVPVKVLRVLKDHAEMRKITLGQVIAEILVADWPKT